ncbi:MAG: zinc ribbon domain-containing protein [Velocimicrobium sp.]
MYINVIADSLGGVSNAYNITPQNSTLNRHGDQAYMEKVIRDAEGCSNFVAEITYPDTKTQIPSHYKFSYVLEGENVKKSRIIFVLFNLLIMAVVSYSLFMVWGDRLFYCNSLLGYILAKTYRFSILAFVIILLVDFYCFYASKKARKKKEQESSGEERKVKRVTLEEKIEVVETEKAGEQNTSSPVDKQEDCPACGAKKRENAIFCGECGYKF